MSQQFSGSQIDKLGDRLRDRPLTLDNLRLLRSFLDSLEPFAESVFARLQAIDLVGQRLFPVTITRRNAKTIRSILAKLRRQPTTLHRMQDLVGCRNVVDSVIDQLDWVEVIIEAFEHVDVVNRVQRPQHGYRAIHLVIREGAKRFEIQVRTYLQDVWANLVERLSDDFGIGIKYGENIRNVQPILQEQSRLIKDFELEQERWQARDVGATTYRRSGYRLFVELTPVNRVTGIDGSSQLITEYDGIGLFSLVDIEEGATVTVGSDNNSIVHAVITHPRAVPAYPSEAIDAIVSAGGRPPLQHAGGYQSKLVSADPNLLGSFEAVFLDRAEELHEKLDALVDELPR